MDAKALHVIIRRVEKQLKKLIESSVALEQEIEAVLDEGRTSRGQQGGRGQGRFAANDSSDWTETGHPEGQTG